MWDEARRAVLRPARHRRRLDRVRSRSARWWRDPDARRRRGQRASRRPARWPSASVSPGDATHGRIDKPEELIAAGMLRGEPGHRRLLIGVLELDQADAGMLAQAVRSRPSSCHRTASGRCPGTTATIPYVLELPGFSASVDYEPAESTTAMFGGNSNWRGPMWFPLNFLVISALERYHRFFGDDFTLEYPTGSGTQLTLREVIADLRDRLVSHLPGRPGRTATVLRRRRAAADRPAVEGQPAVLRVLPRRQRRPASAPPTRPAGPASSRT